MTVANTTSRNQYTATSGQTVFPYTFEIFDKGDVVVLKNGTALSEGTNYTVSGVGNDNGGNITLTVGATAGDILTIYRDMAYQRTTDYQTSGDFLAQEVNDDFDRLWLAVQQNEQANDRAIVKPITDAASIDMTLPSAADRANSYLTFDATGAPSVVAAGDPSAPDAITRQDFTGDGSTLVYTLASAPGAAGAGVMIFIDGIQQDKDSYTITGTTLTFSEAPPLNSNINLVQLKATDIGEADSASVTYIPAGTGAVQTSVQSKLRETVSVKDFGAVGDGVTDDTAAIQAAIDSGAKFVRIPEGTFLISDQIDLVSNQSIKCDGIITVTAGINPASALFTAVSKTNIKWSGGTIDATANTSFASNFFYLSACSKVKISDVQLIDSGVDRYPNGGIRTTNCSHLMMSNIQMFDIGGLGLQTFGDTHSHFSNMFIEQSTTRSGVETNNGNHNVYTNFIIDCAGTANSAFSFNDKHSVCSNNSCTGGAFGITVGHAAPYEADYSTVTGNTIDSPATSGINIQASENVAVSGNVVYNTSVGLQATTSALSGAVSGNVISVVSSIGMRLGGYYSASGNVVNGFTSTGYRSHFDTAHCVLTGNIALNSTSGTGTAFDWGLAPSQINAVVVGNFAGDNKGSPTLVTGFRANNNQNYFLGNATDGNATFRQFDGPYSSATQKDLSVSTLEDGVFYKQIAGGSGSAGAGNQYIALTLNNGATYKVLHDGTV